MNKEAYKVIHATPKTASKLRKWWRKNDYKVLRVVLFPIWAISALNIKYHNYRVKREVWDEERATEILNYYIPRASEWSELGKRFYFFDNGMGWNIKLAKRYLKRKDRFFWKTHSAFFGGEIRQLLIDKFELEGFTKELGNCSEEWTEMEFFLKPNLNIQED